MSLISQITKDHNEVKNFYKEYEKYRKANDFVEAKKWYNQFAWEVARHSAAEELVVYPIMQKHNIAGIEQNLSEHQEVKEKLARTEALDIENTEFQTIMQTVMNSLEEHMSNEENTELPNLAKVVSDERLDELGIIIFIYYSCKLFFVMNFINSCITILLISFLLHFMYSNLLIIFILTENYYF
jgi:iron-sulfur cluster repair protein YtfE (RIC family)